ncbi:MAG: Mu transposase C-terminal domain-containing protein [Desulfovibrionaceae bacterium]|nr:Mu transposase C-terminal domain-containing protein [Desulfovibrionaceae bacterium]MBF0513668.1 Mu transposase C-terminal domain-containing protein [Desulfovibrionaceae bacterium]
MQTAPTDRLTAKNLAKILGVSVQAVSKRAASESWPSEKRHGKGGGKIFPLTSLPEPIRIAVKRARSGLTLLPGGQSQAPVPSVSPASIPVAPAPPDPGLKPAALARAALKADLVRNYLQAKDWARKHGKTVAKAREAFVVGHNSGALYPAILAELGPTSWQTLERWAVELRRADHDCAALAPRHGRHRQGVSKVTEAEAETLMKLLLHQHKFKTATAIEMTKMLLAQKGIASPSSVSTLRNYVESFKRQHADVWTLSRDGQKALVDKIAPFFRRDDSLLSVGDVLIADGHPCNFRVIHPMTGKPVRPVLIAYQDWASRDIAGYTYMLTEDVSAIHLALYRSILRLGKIPKAVLLDNGRAFKAKVFTQNIDLESSGCAGLYGRLNILTAFATPYLARVKPIESFFKTMGLSFEKMVGSYVGGSIEAKPARMKRNEKFMQKLAPDRVFALEDACGLFEAWLDNFYRQRVHSGLRGRTPGEVFGAGQGSGLDHRSLRFLMMHEEVKTPRNNGITMFGREYWHEALYGLRERVCVRFDWHDLRQVWIYAMSGEFMCRADRRELVHPLFALAGGKDADGYGAYREQLREHKSLVRGTQKLVAQAARMGKLDEAADSIPWAALMGAPKLPGKLEEVAAANEPAVNLPPAPAAQIDEGFKPTQAGRVVDPTDLSWMSEADLDAEWNRIQAKHKGGEICENSLRSPIT